MVRKSQIVSFGSVLRQSHNSRKFYNLKLYENLKIPENIDFKEFKIKKRFK